MPDEHEVKNVLGLRDQLHGVLGRGGDGACMVKRGGIVNVGAASGWEGHGLSEGSEVLGLSSRVRRAAPSLRMLAEETVEASHGLAKTATLAMLWRRRWRGSCRPP